jgi:hypothetical protein
MLREDGGNIHPRRLSLKDSLSVLDFGVYHCIRNWSRLIFSRPAVGAIWQVREVEVPCYR